MKEFWVAADKVLGSVVDRLALIAGMPIIIMAVGIGREIVGRYFLGAPTQWSVEISENIMVWVVFLGAPYLIFRQGHIRADVFYSKYPKRMKAVADIIIYLVMLSYLGMLSYQAISYNYYLFTRGMKSSSAMGWPLFPIHLTVVIGCVFSFIIAFYLLIRKIYSLSGGEHGN